MDLFELMLTGLIASLLSAIIVYFPFVIRDAFARQPEVLTPAARRFIELLYEANRYRPHALRCVNPVHDRPFNDVPPLPEWATWGVSA